MLLCLYRHPSITPERPRLGLVRDDDIVDLHLACYVSMVPRMTARRAVEIAEALVPPTLLAFLESGRPAWTAINDSIARLGDELAPGLTTPEGDLVVVPKSEARLSPLVPPAAGWSSETLGTWATTPVPSPGSDAIVALHTDGQAYLPEYLAVVSATGSEATVADPLDVVAFVAVVRPSRPESACLLHPGGALRAAEPDAAATIATAVAAASAARPLDTGDVVRCGPSMLSNAPLDLRDGRTGHTTAGSDADILPTY